MKKSRKIIVAFLSIAIIFFLSLGYRTDVDVKSSDSVTASNLLLKNKVNVPIGLKKLLAAYPDYLDSADENYLYWKDGTKMIYDDGIKKDYEEMLDNASLKDMMSQEYTMGENFENPPPENFEPGRIRNEEFFRKMYGNSASEVQSNLVNVSWMPKNAGLNVLFTRINDANVQLQAVSKELENLTGDLKKYVTKLAGSYFWRVIAGTSRLSMHSFGIAIDINTDYSNYWQWDSGKKGKITYRNQIPMEIVKIFEKYGFIWGGKWYHYDTMHFEYRPELIVTINN